MTSGGREDILGRLTPAARRLLRQRSGEPARPLDGELLEAPLTPAQESIWFKEKMGDAGAVFCAQQLERIEGSLDLPRFSQACEQLARLHPLLRATFISTDSGLRQRVHDTVPECPVVDCLNWSDEEYEANLLEFATRPFDLENSSPLRWRLLRRGPDLTFFQAVVHQICSDRLSHLIFRRHLSHLYQGVRVESPGANFLACATARAGKFSASPDLDPIGFPPSLPRPVSLRAAGARRSLEIPQRLCERLGEFSQESGITIYSVTLTCWCLLLQKLTGQHEFAIESHASGREGESQQDVIGCFIRLLLVRVRLLPSMTFRESLSAVQSASWAALSQDPPFPSPKLPIVFDYYDESGEGALDLGVARVSSLPSLHLTAEAEIHLQVFRSGQGMTLRVTYHPDLYHPSTIASFGTMFLDVLSQGTRRPDLKLESFSLAEPPELRPADVKTTEDNLYEAFSRQVEATPEALALLSRGEELTFRELWRWSQSLARRLEEKGVRAGHVVAIELERSLSSVVAQLAVLCLGAIFVSLEPTLPNRRRALIKEDANPIASITSEDFHNLPSGRPERSARGEGGAYLLYTSGTSGHPKGVLGTHRGLRNRAAWMAREFPFAPGEVVAHKTPLAFVDSLWEVFGPLLHGATVAVLSPSQAEPFRLVEECRRHGVTRLVLVPSLLESLLVDDWSLPDLKLCISSGEELHPTLAARFRQVAPRTALLNLYGSTEVAGDVTYHLSRSEDKEIPLGRAIEGNQVFVLSPSAEPLPDGVPGEIFVSGKQLALGYWNQPELTAQRFRPAPWNPDLILFATGDRGMSREGVIHFLGRADAQVKLMGQRAEIGEVESALRGLDGIREVAVLATGESQRPRLAAFLVVAPEFLQPIPSARRYLGELLSPALIPSCWRVLEVLPRTASGKLDRQALLTELEKPQSDSVIPVDVLEQKLLESWRKVLGVESLHPNSDFFEHGGDSLKALELFCELQRSLGVTFPAHAIFHHSTVRQLGQLIVQHHSSQLLSFFPPHPGRPQILFTHGIVGGVEVYAELSRELATGWNCHGLATSNKVLESHRDLSRLVAEYLVELQLQSSELPYVVAGLSGGGLVALELATQLHRQGLATPTVVLLDSYPPGSWRSFQKLPLLQRMMVKLDNLLRSFPTLMGFPTSRQRWAYLYELLYSQLPGLFDFGQMLKRGEWKSAWSRLRLQSDERTPAHLLGGGVTDKVLEMLSRHQLQTVYPGRVIFYRSVLRPGHTLPDVTEEWRRWLPYLEEVPLAAPHGSGMVSFPMSELLAADLTRRLGPATAPDKEGVRNAPEESPGLVA